MLSRVAPEANLDVTILGVGQREFRDGAVHFVPVAAQAASESQYVRSLRRELRRNPGLVPPTAVVLANAEHYAWAFRHHTSPVVLVAHGVVSSTLAARRGWAYTWFFRHVVERAAVTRASKILVVNAQVGEYYAGQYPKATAGKILQLEIGILPEEFADRPRTNVAIAGVNSRFPTILFVGRLSPEKNVDLFVEACDRLVASGERFVALVVGDGPGASELSVLRRTRPWLSWLPSLPREALLDVMSTAKLLAICSTYEGLPTVLLEALASGIPVVSTDVGRSAELLQPPLGIVSSATPAAFADGMRQLMALDSAVVRDAARAILSSIDFHRTVQSIAKVLAEANNWDAKVRD